MSELQDNPHLIQQQRQQRQILAMMGIQHWVRPDSPTQSIADISSIIEPDLISNPIVASPVSAMIGLSGANIQINEHSNGSVNSPVSVIDITGARSHYPMHNADIDNRNNSNNNNNNDNDNNNAHGVSSLAPNNLNNATMEVASYSNAISDKVYHFDTVAESKVAQSSVSTPDGATLSNPHDPLMGQDTVSPFDLQGGCFGNWVLIVDIKSLTHDAQKLWQNITQALSLSCENTSFPHCSGMDTVELANASLSGYLFKVGRREDIKVAALTPLPQGVTHPYLFSVPTLTEMIADCHLKREFWSQINGE